MLLVLLIGLLLPARGSFVGPRRRWNIICLRWKCLSKIKYRTPFNNEMLNRCQNGQMCSCNSILDGNIWPYGQNQRKLFLISKHVVGGHFVFNKKERKCLHSVGQCRRLSIFAAPKRQNCRSSVPFSIPNPKQNISSIYLKLPPPGYCKRSRHWFLQIIVSSLVNNYAYFMHLYTFNIESVCLQFYLLCSFGIRSIKQ